MSQVSDTWELSVAPLSRGSEFRLPYPVPASVKRRRKDTMASWAEIGHTLSPTVLELAEEFVSACERKGAFYCDPGCYVDFIEDDQVMFDWNNGQLPIFTVLIGSDHPQVVFVGKFKEGKITGETTNLELLEAPLERLVKEIGNPVWTTAFSPDSSTHVVSVVSALAEPLSIPHLPMGGSLSSPQMAYPNRISQTPDVMWPVRRTKTFSSAGLA